MRRALVVLVLAACKGGLFVDQGNDFPCDFSQPEGARDAVCAPGEVCGADNLCRAYRYEGPQFELGATEPHFAGVTSLHPQPLLSVPVLALSHRFERSSGLDRGFAVVDAPGGPTVALIVAGREVRVSEADLPPQLPALALSSLAVPGSSWAAAVVSLPGGADTALVATLSPDGGLVPSPIRENGMLVLGADRLRSGNDVAVLLRLLPDGGARAGEVTADTTYTELALTDPDGGGPLTPLEARYLPGDDLLLLANEGFFLRRSGAVTRLSSIDTELPDLRPLPPAAPLRAELKVDVSDTVVAFSRDRLGDALVLSSWRLDRGPRPGITRMWADCSPCRVGKMVAFTPTLDPTPGVEVVCAGPVELGNPDAGVALSLIKVVGSAAADERQECVTEPLSAPFDLFQVSQVALGRRVREGGGAMAALDDASGAGVLIGGRRGQLWGGASFSHALPLFLERTPLSTGTVVIADGGSTPVALTDRYAALFKQGSGFEVVDVTKASAVPLADGVVASAFVGQSRGWGVLSTADTLFLRPPGDDAGATLTYGPRLLDARGAAARAPFFGEAVPDNQGFADGGLVSLVLTADDSLYFTPVPPTSTASPNVLEPLTPVLTPQPSAPIRSLALERSVVGTNGVDKVRAYVVAGRSLFVVTLSGTPPRWVATPIVLQGGEPLEVWMDNPLGGLGRVGYRDGEVFTLPGGFLLVAELPRVDGGQPAQVLDYENLGGWPVALTNNGLYEAHFPVVNGVLQNRFADGGINRAMQWNKLTLDGGAEPWLGKNARLQVTQDIEPFTPESGVQGPQPVNIHVFHLLVYMDDQVLEVGTLSRR